MTVSMAIFLLLLGGLIALLITRWWIKKGIEIEVGVEEILSGLQKERRFLFDPDLPLGKNKRDRFADLIMVNPKYFEVQVKIRVFREKLEKRGIDSGSILVPPEINTNKNGILKPRREIPITRKSNGH